MRNIFLSYGTSAFAAARDQLCASALAVGFDAALARGPEHLDPDFARANAALLSRPRGGGYWAWKPQIILQELRSLGPGDVLVYCDAGRSPYTRLTLLPATLLEKARSLGFLVGPMIPQHGPISRWTKRDALLLLGMDRPEIHALPPVQATWSLWTPTPAAFRFLEHWQEACADPRCVSDDPNTLGEENLPDFRDHRHDQALASLLAYRENAPVLDYRNTPLFRILALRPQSSLAHAFLKRLDDAERMERGEVIMGVFRSFLSIKRASVQSGRKRSAAEPSM